MSWSTFGGVHADIYTALLVARCFSDGKSLDKDTLSEQFRLHLNRGLGYLVEPDGPKSLEDLSFCSYQKTFLITAAASPFQPSLLSH